MRVEYTVCDVCHEHPGLIFREYLDRVFCSLECWQEYWTNDWTHWMDTEFGKREAENIRYFGERDYGKTNEEKKQTG